MNAILLAAGFGTRLRPLTEKIPKPLIPVAGLPLIFYNLALLKKHGIRDVVINLHYLGGQIQKLLGNGRRWGFRFRYSHEKDILGTGGGIKKASGFFPGKPFLVLNGDIIIDVNLKDLLAFHKKNRSPGTLVVKKMNREKYGPLYVNRRNEIVSMLEKTEGRHEKTFFTGVHVLHPKLLANISSRKKSCIVRDVYIPHLKNGMILRAYPLKGYWNDLGDFKRLHETEAALKKKKIRLSYAKELEQFIDF